MSEAFSLSLSLATHSNGVGAEQDGRCAEGDLLWKREAALRERGSVLPDTASKALVGQAALVIAICFALKEPLPLAPHCCV